MVDNKQVFTNGQEFHANLKEHTLKIVEHVLDLDKNNIVDRIWKNDYKVWNNSADDISNRLGWLHSPNVMQNAVFEIKSFVDEIRESKFNKAILLGMGGSSLAPEVFRSIFKTKIGFLDLVVLDSTDPGAVLKIESEMDVKNTLFIVSTKSGGTVETISFMKYFYHLVFKKIGKKDAGKHFIAITDPGSGLEKQAKELGFRKIFLNDPNIGGRYSALSYFGLVPAALIGMDILKLLEKGNRMADYSRESVLLETGQNTAAWLGAIMGGLALEEIDKLTFISSSSLLYIGTWIEQLVAESTGKLGKGILPVCSTGPGSPEIYSNDRLFIYIKLEGEDDYDQSMKLLEEAGHPVVKIIVKDIYDLGSEMFRWEIATIVAGHILKINPFDQPDVESAKISAREMVTEFKKTGKLPVLPVTLDADGLKVYTSVRGESINTVVNTFLEPLVTSEDASNRKRYLAIQAYLNPTDEIRILLEKLSEKIQNQFGVAVTIGFGPRFLHSTGQLHKGDDGTGLFLQLLANMPEDCAIPDNPKDDTSSISFGILKTSQALGDRQALIDAGRDVMRIDLGNDIAKGIGKLIGAVE